MTPPSPPPEQTSTTNEIPAQAGSPARGWDPYRLTVQQYLKSIEVGAIPGSNHLELLGGIFLRQAARSPGHDFAVGGLGSLLHRMVPEEWIAREQRTVEMGRTWLVHPDISVLRAPHTLYRARHPIAAEAALIAEVSEASYAIDRGPKWRRYAAVGIPVFWILDLAKHRVEVYCDPTGKGRAASYQKLATFDGDAQIPVIIEGREVGRVDAREILP